MTSATLLAFDTSGPYIAAALGTGGALRAKRHEDMAKGQAEALMPLLETMLTEAELTWHDLTGIGVGIGPGNFTGIRISVSAARGLGLALGIPVVGLSAFALRRDLDHPQSTGNELVTLAAPRGLLYGQMFSNGAADGPPRIIDTSEPPLDLRRDDLTIIGDGAIELSRHFGGTAVEEPLTDLPRRLLDLTDQLVRRADACDSRPAPLYVRPADAAPARDAGPPILP